MAGGQFSAESRARALEAMGGEEFDLLVIGGGITGAAVARDAATRGMRVALVEKDDFAQGTSSRSSKLVHGGLRYLENREFSLVFEALAERSLLLRTVPHMVRPLPFYFPVYEGDPHGRLEIGLGMLLYDLLALFRTPGMHRRFSAEELQREIPGLRSEGLKGGFRYFDASMWDDMLVIELLRDCVRLGVRVASRAEAVEPIWRAPTRPQKQSDPELAGFAVRDLEEGASGRGPIQVRARQTVVCAGPWTDFVGKRLSAGWRDWLKPSKGVHLVFDLKRLPVPGALVMSHPTDGRISFVIPRPDLGAGVTIVGTTDGPTPAEPERASVARDDVDYLLALLARYFAGLKLTREDIVSTYVGVRPLVAPGAHPAWGARATQGDPGAKPGPASLSKVSREHEIITGPGGAVIVAGGKYTTHRKMAEEIVDYAIHEARQRGLRAKWAKPSTERPPNPAATEVAIGVARREARDGAGGALPEDLLGRYGREAFRVRELQAEAERVATGLAALGDPEGFSCLGGQLLFQLREGGALRLEDFYHRRTPLYLARADHGLPWAEALSRVWAHDRGVGEDARLRELEALRREFAERERGWR